MAMDKERLSKTKRLLIETLEDLGDEELKNFQWFLQQDDILEGFPAIRKSKVEKANRQDTVDQMVQTYHHHSLKVTKKVLMKINRNDLEQSLSNSSSGPKGRHVADIMPLPEAIGASVAEAAAGVRGEVAQLFPTHRQCTVLITNGCSHHTLCNPRMFISSGRCSVPLSPTVDPSTSETALFTKTPYTARGSVGVFTYDLLNNHTKRATEKMAVMFHVPYDFNLYSNCYAVGIFDMSKICDNNLYLHMHKKHVNGFVRGDPKFDCSLTYKSHDVTIMVTMSDTYQPVMKVQLSDKE